MPELAYLNGTFGPISQAKVSIEDRGFQFADGVYEVVAFHKDQPIMLEEHLERLANSCRAIQFNPDLERLNLVETIHEGVRRAGFDQTMVYLQLTRGAAPRHHIYPESCEPTVVMTFKPKPVIPDEKRQKGLSLMALADFRWSRCHVKSIALLPNVMAKNEAQAKGFDDVVFVGPDGDVRETSAANLFIIQSGRLLTRPQDQTILPGITRQLVLACAQEIDLPLKEDRIVLDDLLKANEAFISSTTIDVLPVVRVDDHTIGTGQPGDLTAALYRQMLKTLESPHR